MHFKVSHPEYRELATQMYFAGDPLNAVDRILGELTPAGQAQGVVDFGTAGPGAIPVGRFDIELARV